ncbi:Hsp20/alpha crystallin family protein [Pseudonocardia spirodelae]|uniref:Hsp20/alpha crystallin family protein n=1 Tax=Pseudonocardia spirodelae TaxID=3133431 RepID=A0ABU8T355_9PSEU
MNAMTTRRAAVLPGPLAEMERMVDDFLRAFPVRRPLPAIGGIEEAMIRVDEFVDGTDLVVRAELPGVDPANDITVTAADGLLTVKAERRSEEEAAEAGYRRRELRRGSMSRVLQLPEGVTEAEIRATYKDGILEVRVPIPAQAEPAEATLIPVTTE